MSNPHAAAGASDHQSPLAFSTAIEMAAAVRAIIWAVAMRIFASIEQHWMQRRLIRLSDHVLRDFGFERDWDGSIRSLRDAD